VTARKNTQALFICSVVLGLFLVLGCRIVKPTLSTPTSVAQTPTETAALLATKVPEKSTPVPVPSSVVVSPAGNTLRLYSDSQPETLDPAVVQDTTSHRFVGLLFSGLVALDSNLEVVPDLAASWDVSASGTVYTFHLRNDATFHDGRPVTAEDVRYSIERACDPRRGSVKRAQSYLDDIVGVMARTMGEASSISGLEVVDDRTIQITIDAPKPYFLSKLTYPTSFVVDRGSVEKDPTGWTSYPIGTGPFKMVDNGADQMVLEAFDGYYGGRPALDRLTFYYRGQSMNQYERGELDVISVGIDYIDRILDPKDPLHDDLRIVPQIDVWYIGFNCAMPPFDDAHVRRAFAYATNKQSIADIVYNKMVVPAKGILPPGMPGYNPDLKELPYAPDLAADEMVESSYGDASELPPIVLTVTGAGTGEMLKEMYSQVLGVDIEVQVVDWGVFLQGLDAQQYQMFSLGWIGDYPDPQNFLDLMFHSQSAYNHSAYSNADVDSLVEMARVEQDESKRMQLYQQAEQLVIEDAPWIPLYHSAAYYLVKPYVKNLEITAQETMNLQQVRIE
jgi:oligopeptide transport system substrate-binding protein